MQGRCGRLGLVLLGSVVAPVAAAAADGCTMPLKPSGLRPASVLRVADGDTIVVRTERGTRRVRMIGVDTPELHPGEKLQRDAGTLRALGARASAFTRKHLHGQRVELERDVTPADRYGRALAYVWVGEELYNLVLVRDGYAGLLTVPPNVKYAGVLAACHREARAGRRGLWGLGPAALGGR